MSSSTLLKTVYSRTNPPTYPLPRCSEIDNAKLKNSIHLTFGLLIAILNLVEIILIAKIKRKKKIYEVILLSLSASDCMFGLSNAFVSIPYIASICRFQEIVEAAYTLYVFFVLTSIFHLLFITVDRLIAVLKPLKHKTYLSRRRFYIYLAIMWILAVLISVLLQIIDSSTNTFKKKALVPSVPKQTLDTTRIPESRMYRPPPPRSPPPRLPGEPESHVFKRDMQFALSVIIIIADVIIISSYSLIIYVTTFKTKKVSSSGNQSIRLPVICVAIAATFVLFTLPYAVARLAFGGVPFVPNFILVLNSGMNSIIYFFRIKISRFCQKKTKKGKTLNWSSETRSVSSLGK